MNDSSDLAGTRVGRYDVISLLGRGGMGSVYDAVDSVLGRHVALKILPPAVAGDAKRLARFVQEARAASALNHPNVVAIYEIGHERVDSHDVHFIAMEKVEGSNLRTVFAGKRLSITQAVEIVAQISGAVAAAHSAGIVHRDLKPENVVMSALGAPKVLDFGLAKLRPDADSGESWSLDDNTALRSTDSGVILGTVGYMSPEQAQGKTADHRSDIFSLGCLLYEAVAGRRAFAAGSAVETLSAVINAEPPPLRDSSPAAPVELQRIVSKATAKNPDQRYQSAKELAIDLRAMARENTLWASGGDPARATRRWRSRLPALGVGLALVTIIAVLLWNRAQPSRATPSESSPVARQLTTSRGFRGTPAISPDGRLVAYSSDQTGTMEIYVVSLTPGSAEVAITSDGGQNLEPAWSPDGQWLAFHSLMHEGIWIVPSTGGTPRQVSEFGSQPAWAPDGERLVFSSGAISKSVLWTVSRDGSGAKTITSIGAPRGGHREPSWSHDGRFIAFYTGDFASIRELFVLSLEDGALHRIARAPYMVSPLFGFDTRSLYWGGTTQEWNSRIWKIAIDPTSGAPSGPAETVLSFDAKLISQLSMSRNGTVAMAFANSDSNLWTITVAADGRAGEPKRLTDQSVRCSRPAYSRDGRIAFTQASVGRPVSTWLINEDGSGLTPLSVDEANHSPKWSSDDRRLLVQRDVGDDVAFSWIDVATRRVQPLMKVSRARASALSPDSQSLAYHVVESDGTMNIWVQPLDGGPARQITHDREGASFPVWSPDGKWIALELLRGDHHQIAIVSAEGGSIEQLTTTPGQCFVNSWSPDGSQVTFAGQRDGVWNIWSVSTSTRTLHQLTQSTSSAGFVRYPVWSPHGDKIVFERSIVESSVWTVAMPGQGASD